MKKLSLFIMALLPAGVLFAPDSRASDYTRWNLPEGALARLGKGGVFPYSQAVALSPDGSQLAVASSIGIWLYDAPTGIEAALLQGHEGWITSVSFSPDGSTLASGGEDSTVRLWDAASGEAKATIQGHEGGVTSVSFSSDGSTLASGGEDGTVRLWDAASFTLEGLLASGGEAKATIQGHERAVTSVWFSPEGILASGSHDGTVRLWTTAGDGIATLLGHEGPVWSVSTPEDCGILASGSHDGTVVDYGW